MRTHVLPRMPPEVRGKLRVLEELKECDHERVNVSRRDEEAGFPILDER